MFMKSERKKRNPALIMTVGALAAIGAASIIRGGKSLVRNIGCRVKGLISTAADEE